MERQMSERRIFPMAPSRWQWTKFKDLYQFYIWLGVIPCSLFIGYHNLFTGPATLTVIPEDCEPKHWEYCRVTNVVLLLLIKIHWFFSNFRIQYLGFWLDICSTILNRITRNFATTYSSNMKR